MKALFVESLLESNHAGPKHKPTDFRLHHISSSPLHSVARPMSSSHTILHPISTTLLPPKPRPLHPRRPIPPPNRLSLRPIIAAAQQPDVHAPISVDMVRGRDGVWSARQSTVVVLWDLDNKPPRGPPYDAALALRRLAELLGRVVDVSAYANRHAFSHLPQWVRDDRRNRRQLDVLERRGVVIPSDPYVCSMCGRKFSTNVELKRHFKQLHERERLKKLARLRSLRGKKRQKYKERFISGNTKYDEGARELLTPKSGYGLAQELRRAGVYVRTVVDKPQAADAALKRQMQHSMTCGVDWMVLVSDDSDFTEMVRRAGEAKLRTVVVGDGCTTLGKHADLWVPWVRVENGEVGEEALLAGRNRSYGNGMLDGGEEEERVFATASFYQEMDMSELEDVVDEIVARNSGLCSGGFRKSAFSDEEDVRVAEDYGSDSLSSIFGSSMTGEKLLWDSEEEDDGYI